MVKALALDTAQREMAYRGSNKPVTREMEEQALQMLADGHPMDVVCDHFQINRSTLLCRGQRDPGFSEELTRAMSMGTVSTINSAMRTARGEEGYTTGSIERDKLVCDMAWRYAKTIGNKIFGDKLQIDQRSIQITVQRDDTDW